MANRIKLGIDTFVAAYPNSETGAGPDGVRAMAELLERIVHAEESGLYSYSIGEHHREEFLDSAAVVILAAAAARTSRIRLGSAVTVLSAADPVRVFQQFATLDLLSGGRAEIVAGRGSFTESFPLFGLRLQDYNELFTEKLELLLKIRENTRITWSGKFRPALHDQAIYPRPVQKELPISVGVGGTPESFVRAGTLGLPLMVAIIGGETHRFRPLVDIYREAGRRAGHSPDKLRVGMHSIGYVAQTREQAIEEFFPGYKQMFDQIGRERGWPPVTMRAFEQAISDQGALIVGGPDEVAAKIKRHSEALGGLDRVAIQMDNSSITHERAMRAIGIMGKLDV